MPTTTTTTADGGATTNETPKLRLMISYGGHILPRPHDKTLFYAGGETRIISIPRNQSSLSLSSLFSHLSKSLVNGSHSFSLKYQLPNHDLDSLISISSDEDLWNMIDEYDRLNSSSPAPSRIRFFLFKNNNNNNKEDGGCGGGYKGDLKSDDDWFADSLKVAGSNLTTTTNNNNNSNSNSNANDSPESIVLESRSSFGSNSSSTNSPANKGSCGDFKAVLPSVDSLGSDCSIPSPNFSQQAIVYQDASGFIDSKPVSANLIEPESIVSDRSPRSDLLSPVQVSGYMVSKPMDQPQLQSPPQLQPPPPQSPPQLQPPPPPHYIHHPAPHPNYVTQYYPGSIPVASYAPMYQPYAQPQQPVQYQHHLHKPYPVYMMPIGQTHNLYDASMPRTLTTAPTVATSQPQLPSNPVMVAPPMVYEGYKPTAPAPEYAANVYVPPSVGTKPVISPPVNQPAQPVTAPPLENTNYEYEDPMHAQIYKTQPSGSTLPSHLQMATSAATMMLSENFSQLQVENTKQ